MIEPPYIVSVLIFGSKSRALEKAAKSDRDHGVVRRILSTSYHINCSIHAWWCRQITSLRIDSLSQNFEKSCSSHTNHLACHGWKSLKIEFWHWLAKTWMLFPKMVVRYIWGWQRYITCCWIDRLSWNLQKTSCSHKNHLSCRARNNLENARWHELAKTLMSPSTI
jgi:hypothetical protein